MEWIHFLGIGWFCLGVMMLGILHDVIDNKIDVMITILGAPIWFLIWIGKKLDDL